MNLAPDDAPALTLFGGLRPIHPRSLEVGYVIRHGSQPHRPLQCEGCFDDLTDGPCRPDGVVVCWACGRQHPLVAPDPNQPDEGSRRS